jgi:hypothetical protein
VAGFTSYQFASQLWAAAAEIKALMRRTMHSDRSAADRDEAGACSAIALRLSPLLSHRAADNVAAVASRYGGDNFATVANHRAPKAVHKSAPYGAENYLGITIIWCGRRPNQGRTLSSFD